MHWSIGGIVSMKYFCSTSVTVAVTDPRPAAKHAAPTPNANALARAPFRHDLKFFCLPVKNSWSSSVVGSAVLSMSRLAIAATECPPAKILEAKTATDDDAYDDNENGGDDDDDDNDDDGFSPPFRLGLLDFLL